MPSDEHHQSGTSSADTFSPDRSKDLNSRAPLPYHRRGPSLSHQDAPSDDLTRLYSTGNVTTEEVDHREGSPDINPSNLKWQEYSDHLGDSGTEADDEKEVSLLRLPAPAPKPRKGLIGSSGSASPLLSPSNLDDEEKRAEWEVQVRQRAPSQTQRIDQDETGVLEKFRRRRWAEIYRRATETALFLGICYIVLGRHLATWAAPQVSRTLSPRPSPVQESQPTGASSLVTFLAIVSALYALYPCRVIIKNHATNASRNRSRFHIHLPAAFDPAPLLYPVLLPCLTAWLIEHGSEDVLILNLVLGLSSIPSKIVPSGGLAWYGSLQWLLSLLPATADFDPRNALHFSISSAKAASSDIEMLSLVFPLHQCLLPVLRSLVTTSLLTAEFQLLSTSLINLYFLSEFPQAKILSLILWMGGLTLLVLCGRALQTGIAIARIPSWRFRRPRSLRRTNVLTAAVEDCLDGSAAQSIFSHRRRNSSDEDTMVSQSARDLPPTRRLSRINTVGLEADIAQGGLSKTPTLPLGTTDETKSRMEMNGFLKDSAFLRQRHRSRTLPTFGSSLEGYPPQASLSGSTSVLRHPKWSLRSMTASQATIMRWLLAFYSYAIIIAAIALPIRKQISLQALHGVEPVGWALGYLFGGLPAFRSFVKRNNLQQWIDLQQSDLVHLRSPNLGRFEVWRMALGLANTRLIISAYALMVIALGLVSVFRLSSVSEVDTRRKVFHGMMVAMFLPTTFVDPTFVGLAFSLVLAVFLILDLIRASQLPPLARPLTAFLAPYVDGRDHRGPVVVSHIFLLIGCAIPLWLSLACLPRNRTAPWPGWEVPTRDLSMTSGIVCVGMGDAAASLFGRRYGHRRWCWTGGKSLEGSLAFVAAVVVGLTIGRTWLLLGQWSGDSGDLWGVFWLKAVCAGCGASLTEAVLTGGNDNVIVPLVLWLLVKGLHI